MIFAVGATSQSLDIQIVDDTGLPVAALVAATFPTLTYSVAGANADVAFPALSDLAAITTAYSSGGVKERGNGVYRLDVPNGCFTVAGQTRIRGEATGKHVIVGTLDVGAQVNATQIGGTNQTARDLGASVIAASVTAGVTLAANQHVIVDSGTVTNVTNQLTAAQIATGVWQDTTSGDFTVASSIGKSLFTSGNAPGVASGLALVGSNVGAAASVTGSVGSVAGNVGGNVVGSVGSVAGAVGSVTAPVTAGTVTDKTGYALSAAGLDQIAVTDPGAIGSMTTLPKMLVALWRRAFKKSTLTVTQLKTYADDGATVDVTQAVSDDGTTQTLGAGT